MFFTSAIGTERLAFATGLSPAATVGDATPGAELPEATGSLPSDAAGAAPPILQSVGRPHEREHDWPG